MRRAGTAMLLALLGPGCAGEVDFVAAGSREVPVPDGGAYITDVQVVEPCLAGTYVGEFWTVSGAAQLSGSISFSLVTGTDQDVLTVERDSRLFGTDEGRNATITAEIVGEGRCGTGAFNSRLERGAYRPDGFPVEIAFDGTVTGTYLADAVPGFFGDWAATAFESVVGEGLWYAFYLPPSSTSRASLRRAAR